MKTPVIVDIETDGRAPQVGRLLLNGWQLADEEHAHVLEPSDWTPDETDRWSPACYELLDMLQDPERPVVTMTKYDARYLNLQHWGVQGPYYDLQVMAWVLNENQTLSLDALAKRYCGITMDKRLNRSAGVLYFRCDCGRRFPLTEMDPAMEGADCHWSAFRKYCVRDVEAETKLFNTLWSRLDSTAWLDYFLDEEAPFTDVLLGMETSGLPVNLTDSEALRARLEVEAEYARDSLLASASLPAGFNVGSRKHLSGYLYGKVYEMSATLDLGSDAVECLKSCLAGEHEDCDLLVDDYPYDEWEVTHIVDLLPARFTIDKVGRTSVQGRYTIKGRGIPPTERTESGDDWSTSSPVLKSNLMALQDGWVTELLAYRKVQKVLTTYLRVFPSIAVNERGETYDQALHRVRDAVRPSDATRPEDASQGGVREDEVLLTGMLPGETESGGNGRVASPGRVQGRFSSGQPTAQGGDGETPSSASPSLRGGASPEWGQVGQPAGEPDALRVAGRPPSVPLGDFRIWGRFNQTGTKTGRLSSSIPNLQNIPSHGPLGEAVRGLFQGDLVVGDYSQLEPRLMAHFSEDPLLLQTYRENHDIYMVTAEGIFGRAVEKESTERGIAKTLVLAMGYGAGPAKVAQILTVNGFLTDEDTARGYLNDLRSLYSTFFAWREAVIDRVKQKGYVVTMGGRHRRLKAAFEDRRNFKNIGYGSRQAVNAVVQGSAGDIVRKSMVEQNRVLSEYLRLLAQVHDELVNEKRRELESDTLDRYRRICEEGHGFKLVVPLVFEPHLGHSWFAAKEGIELPEDLNEESSGYEEDV